MTTQQKTNVSENLLKPKQIDIEVSSHCNLKCRFCPGLDSTFMHMDVELFESIIDRVNFKTTIVPWLNGEPLLHPEYPRMLQAIEKKNLRYYITTNGMIWRDDVFDIILDQKSSCYQLIISLDGMLNSRSIELARPGTKVNRVWETIKTVLKRKPQNLDLAVKICRRGQDYEEIEQYISFWLEHGVDYVCVGDALIEEENPVGFRSNPCQYSDNNFMVIKVDGRLVRCAYNDLATNDEQYSFGVMDKTTPLLEIYNNDFYTRFREDQNSGIYPGPCDTCGISYTGHGMSGSIKFRNPHLIQDTIYYQRDYYNSFFSLKEKRKSPEYYMHGGQM